MDQSQPTQPVAPTPQSGGAMKWLLIILVIIILGAGAYYFFVVKGGSTSTSTVPTSTSPTLTTTIVSPPVVSPSSTPAATASVPADWKTYTNSNFGFSFRYPATLTLNESNGIAANSWSVTLNSTGQTAPELDVSVEPSEGKSLDAIIIDKQSGKTISSQQKTTFTGKTAYEGIDTGIINNYGLYVVNNSMFYKLSLYAKDKETLSDLKSALNANQNMILSTFQFTK